MSKEIHPSTVSCTNNENSPNNTNNHDNDSATKNNSINERLLVSPIHVDRLKDSIMTIEKTD